jgi:hypothetical protein
MIIEMISPSSLRVYHQHPFIPSTSSTATTPGGITYEHRWIGPGGMWATISTL